MQATKAVSKYKKVKEGNRPGWLRSHANTWYVNFLFCFLVPLITLVGMEWIARGTLAGNTAGNGFVQAVAKHFASFAIAYLLLLSVYILLLAVTSRHLLSIIMVELLGFVPGVVTYYKLILRGEPFLPWDFAQIDELVSIGGSISFDIQANMVIMLLVFVAIGFAGSFVRLPQKRDLVSRGFMGAGALGCILLLLFGIFLNPAGSQGLGIQEDSWMQDRYYRNHGVITGFLTNLQMLDIDKPSGYSAQAVGRIAEETLQNAGERGPLYENSYAATGTGTVEQPDIIYVMAESFWDVTALDGIEYDREILPNLTRLAGEGAYGWAYTPSFGGGTCDVEFEALTGFSMEHLPSGSKPYQQYVTSTTPSLPNYLKGQGYTNVAIHGYGAAFWSRDTAYPNLGFDDFIASDGFQNPAYRRGFISDDAMVEQIMYEYEKYAGEPLFIHAVTMQNHTTYSRDRYPEGELVNVTSAPAGLTDSVIGQLEDCATGMSEMDAALGKLCDYLRERDRPTIVVFWGDHLNPMSDGYSLFTETGYIDEVDTSSPELHKTPLLIWSNYDDTSIDLGVVATYELAPVMMDLYGLDMPVWFEFLAQQLDVMRAKTRGVVVNTDGSISHEMSEEQEAYFYSKAILQYDQMFAGDHLAGYTLDK